VERRGLAEGNLAEQNRVRTRGRAALHSALGRVRQAARRDPSGTPVRHYSRQEPGALAAHVGICAGGAGRPAFLPRPEIAGTVVKNELAEIRIATMSDAAAIAELSNQLGYQTSAQQSETRLGSVLVSIDHAVFVACVDGAVVGWVHAFVARRIESDAFAELGGFVVAESHRRRGIGRRLLKRAEEWALAQGVTKLRVRSRSDRDDARASYENLGFSIKKEQRVFDKPLRRSA
jgi:GNAT superfamily N-acetyltransferase